MIYGRKIGFPRSTMVKNKRKVAEILREEGLLFVIADPLIAIARVKENTHRDRVQGITIMMYRGIELWDHLVFTTTAKKEQRLHQQQLQQQK